MRIDQELLAIAHNLRIMEDIDRVAQEYADAFPSDATAVDIVRDQRGINANRLFNGCEV